MKSERDMDPLLDTCLKILTMMGLEVLLITDKIPRNLAKVSKVP
jgi:hypothetical protein